MTRRATSLAEMLVVSAIAAVFFSAIYLFWVSATRQTVDLEARVSALTRGQVALATLQRELQLARRLLVPAPGAPAQPGCVFVSADGLPVAVELEPGQPAGRLVRIDVTNRRRTPLADGIVEAAFRVPAAPPGRDADLMHVTLGMAGPNDRPLYLVTSARARAVEPGCLITR